MLTDQIIIQIFAQGFWTVGQPIFTGKATNRIKEFPDGRGADTWSNMGGKPIVLIR